MQPADPSRATHGTRPLVGLSMVMVLAVASGCASVPMAAKEQDAAAKTFTTPDATKAGLYLYRDSFVGQALRKNLSVDGKLIGATANKTYFFREIASGPHILTTESEFGDNTLPLDVVGGRNYFVRQYIKMGVFVGGSDLEVVSEEEGRKGVLAGELAQPVEVGPATRGTAGATAVAASGAMASETPRWVGQARKPRAVPIDEIPISTPTPAPPIVVAARIAERGNLAVVSASLVKYQVAAETFARDNACHSHPVAALAAIDPLAEIYTIGCTTGEAMIVRCDANACRAMK